MMKKEIDHIKKTQSIAGVSLNSLREKYGTPLMILDQEQLLANCQVFKSSFKTQRETEIAYASKANLNRHIAKTIANQGLSFDVASQGELYILKQAGVDLNKVYFHGNNKLAEELDYAIANDVGIIVLDNFDEVKRLASLLDKHDKKQAVLLRLNPSIPTNTHAYIQTSDSDSKFGVSIHDEHVHEIISFINNSKHLEFKGFHSHIGSQIFESESFEKAVTIILDFIVEAEKKHPIQVEVLNVGGGFGVPYTEKDPKRDLGKFLENYANFINEAIDKRGLQISKIVIEPGRSLINQAMHSLYTVGSQKTTVNGKNYLFVDGGMSDNLRPALYQADYDALLLNDSQAIQTVCVAGKLCESGDVLIESIDLPKAQENDLLLIPFTGAYTYSMSSNYNKMLRPAVVALEKGQHKLIVRRETLEDLIRLDVQ